MIFKQLMQFKILLTKEEIYSAVKLLILIIVAGIFDLLGVAAVLPFMSVASDPSYIESNKMISYIYHYFEFDDHNSFVLFLGLWLIILIILSTIIKVTTIYFTHSFTFKREHSLSLRFLKGFLNQPYSWFVNQHRADLSRTILADVREVVGRSMLTTLNVISNGFSVIMILGFLVLVDTVTAVLAFLCFGFIYLGLFSIVKKRLSRIGIDRLNASKVRYKSSNEIFSLVKEIKILGKENFYVSLFDQATKTFTNNEITMQAVSSLPRYFIEMVAFTSMILVVLINILSGSELSTFIPLLALYAFAVYRLIPSIQIIFSNIVLFRASTSYLTELIEKYKILNVSPSFEDISEGINFRKEITFNSISYKYPKAEKNSVSHISIKIPSQNIIGIIGPTGSGKTTIVDILLGLLRPDQGEIYVDDIRICEDNVRQWQTHIGYVPQHISLIDETILANIALGENSDDLDMESIVAAAKVANIHNFILSELEDGYNTKVGDNGVRLSGGQRQRIGIARALYNKPDILVLDEATSALDDGTEQAVMEAVNNLDRNLTIVIIAHRLSTLSKADIVYRLEKGQLHSQGSYQHMCENIDSK
jgi:ATP-binding cassette, subfamily B, bacterial PglK